MNDYQLGAALRTQVIQDRQRGLPVEGRRLQALVGDLGGAEQAALLPALRYLVFCPAFHSAASQAEPLADPRLLTRLMQELQEVFTPAICQRMQAVVQGLLGLPTPPIAGAAAVVAPAPVPAPAPEPASLVALPLPLDDPRPPTPDQALALLAANRSGAGGGGSRSLVVVLSFLCGGLLVGLLSLLVFMQLAGRRQPQLGASETPSPVPVAQPVAPPATPTLPEPEPSPPTTQEAASSGAANLNQAISRVQELYGALSSKNYDAARGFFAGAAADQFDPSFFNQFERVSVGELRESGRSGSTLTLDGQVTFLYPDGTSQLETRSFTVDTATTPAVITNSTFGQVLRSRQ
ncbi:hypothetical protein KBZ20_01690 [Vulcanococcus limneticus Candia 3F8]|uniref:hypothetical protein n=1 Tax=Vulcanococcus limneticus TaxID=2170428 RepID=UPI000B991FB0|nr:hypothetical protein [Vulcanococcus limneticus]MCP9790291.1 hypothetical protein [Vulcanococcus limneticus MW73D5]MCP9892488.1 hypothetical protein [Vulcanococcus limneticus Candia 3F8]MCP9895690.1 hypothetical protein [Vulcanococcus limneticus Candia 3B3]